MNIKEIYQVYQTHKRNARKREVPFLISFDEWCKIWFDSGHWHERGHNKGNYVMCRKGDVGPYSVDNVYIDLHEINAGLARKGKKNSSEHSFKISQALKGKKKSTTAVAKNAISQLSRPKYTCQHCNKLISGAGNLKQHIANKHKEIE